MTYGQFSDVESWMGVTHWLSIKNTQRAQSLGEQLCGRIYIYYYSGRSCDVVGTRISYLAGANKRLHRRRADEN